MLHFLPRIVVVQKIPVLEIPEASDPQEPFLRLFQKFTWGLQPNLYFLSTAMGVCKGPQGIRGQPIWRHRPSNLKQEFYIIHITASFLSYTSTAVAIPFTRNIPFLARYSSFPGRLPEPFLKCGCQLHHNILDMISWRRNRHHYLLLYSPLKFHCCKVMFLVISNLLVPIN